MCLAGANKGVPMTCEKNTMMVHKAAKEILGESKGPLDVIKRHGGTMRIIKRKLSSRKSVWRLYTCDNERKLGEVSLNKKRGKKKPWARWKKAMRSVKGVSYSKEFKELHRNY